MADRCRMCGMPVHRYSPDHPQHGPEGRWDAMGCVNSLKPEVERLRDVLGDLVDFTDRHRLSYDDHGHDCYAEWAMLRDEARRLLADREPSDG